MMISALRVWLVCTGVGVLNRGIETFFRDCFEGLRPHLPDDVRLTLFKGAGPEVPPDEHRLWCLPRTGRAAGLLGTFLRRTPYVAEQLSSVLPLLGRLRAAGSSSPNLIFTSEGNLLLALRRVQRLTGAMLPPILFSNGGPVDPPFPLPDHVQQVTPDGMERAQAAGEAPEKHSLVPYGLSVPSGEPESLGTADRQALRARLGLPTDTRPLVLSVGWIARGHKRMDYTVNEVAALPTDRRPHLVLLGAMDSASKEVIALARERLGPAGFTARSVAPEDVADYYRTADVFTLASLHEGFGRVYLEALAHGLPCVVHDAPTMHYVLGEEGYFAELDRPGAMTAALAAILQVPDLSPNARARRRASVRRRFSWEILAPAYVGMFRRATLLHQKGAILHH